MARAENIFATARKCPICRETVTGILRNYTASFGYTDPEELHGFGGIASR